MSDWTVNLELEEGNSAKFWRARVDGTTLYVNYGRIGTTGQFQIKKLSTADAARKELEKLEREKRKKGYTDAAGAPEDEDEDENEGEDEDEEEVVAVPPAKKAAKKESAPATDGMVVDARLTLDANGRRIATHLSLQGATVRMDAVETYANPKEARKAYDRLLAILASEGHEQQ